MIDNHDNFAHLLYFIVISTHDEVTLLRAIMDGDGGMPPCALISPPDAGCSMGVAWWRALTADVPAPAFLDCGIAAGRAAEGLRAGLAGVIVDPACTQHAALAGLARVTGGRCLRARPDAHAIGGPDAAARLRAYLRHTPSGGHVPHGT
ncbi:hypothetical protein [Gluconacetobacter entanii]|uniref:hypothetical protein n=1 Tax=Gluconacetobacter entanii TaxID=108528 RepID=UPI0021BBF61B|nr:hypothetical protein [Gluconacetobacter entanii]MCW4580032.1 hypothetical protein [Gluconacetobacter entanii]MCW4583419.1 hypothetical protein [Gluconacetobacter entanii]MCW4586765.1 hypothetical protein [Gluconacetobacter entanii]